MIAAHKRERAFTAFLEGKSLRQISDEDWSPALRTLESWSATEGWIEKRKQAWSQARARAATEVLPKISEQATIEMQKLSVAATAASQLHAVLKGDLPAKALPLSPQKLIRLIVAACRGQK